MRSVTNPSSPQAGSKLTLLEGGIHVPLIAFWPNGIEPGTTNDSVMTTADLMPTIFDLMGGDPSAFYGEITGRSLADALTGDVVLAHDPIFWELAIAPRRTADYADQATYAMRVGDYKIIKLAGADADDPRSYRIYDLSLDPGERRNLAVSNPELLDALRRQLDSQRAEAADLDFLPSSFAGAQLVGFDARMDAAGRDTTLTMTLTVNSNDGDGLLIFDHPGAQSARVLADGSIEWRLRCYDVVGVANETAEGMVLDYVLVTPPLSEGPHQIVFRLDGNRGVDLAAMIMVDGVEVARLDPATGQAPNALISSVADWTFGDDALSIDAFQYFNNALYGAEPFVARLAPPVVGTSGVDSLIGPATDGLMLGFAGNDTLTGGAGNDTLDGGLGNDRLNYTGGHDALLGGAGTDWAQFNRSAQAVTVSLAVTSTQAFGNGSVVLRGIESLRGSAHGDHLTGNGSSNLLYGNAGDDRIIGGLGRDTLVGGKGDDLLSGDREGVGLDTDGGADRLDGQSGDDLLHGGAGADVLTGGAGADRFLFAAPDFGGLGGDLCDVIVDFDAASGDVIDLSAFGSGIGAVLTLTGLSEFTGMAGEIIAHAADTGLILSCDMDGDGAADWMLRLDGLAVVEASSFIL